METVHDTLAQELRALVVENLLFGQLDGRLDDDDSFLEKGIIDSTGVLELVSLLEERYSIRVEDEDLIPQNLDSINGLKRYVESKLRPEQVAGAQAIGEQACR
jgi:acyl carrier protein